MATNAHHPAHGWPDEWPRRLLAGDQTVLHELLLSHGTFFRNTVTCWFATLAMFADDMVQTALVRVWRSIRTFDESRGPGTFQRWFLTVLRNTCLDFLRSNLHRSMDIETASFSAGLEDGDGVPEPTSGRHLLERSTDDPPPPQASREADDLTDILNNLPAIKRRIILHWVVHRGFGPWAEELHRDLLADDPPIVIKPATLRVHRLRIWQTICEQLRARGHVVPDEPRDEPLPGGGGTRPEGNPDVSADLLGDLDD